MQRATRCAEAAPCRTCGSQPLHVHRFAHDGSHSYECPPCGVSTGYFPSALVARHAWWVQHGADTPNPPAVRPASDAPRAYLPLAGARVAPLPARTPPAPAAGSAAAAPGPVVVTGPGRSVHYLIRSTRNNGHRSPGADDLLERAMERAV